LLLTLSILHDIVGPFLLPLLEDAIVVLIGKYLFL
jgi:hypothetical protein